MTNCKPFRRNPHSCCNFFPLPRVSRRPNAIGRYAPRHERTTGAMVTTYNRGRPQTRGKESGELTETQRGAEICMRGIAVGEGVIKLTLQYVYSLHCAR